MYHKLHSQTLVMASILLTNDLIVTDLPTASSFLFNKIFKFSPNSEGVSCLDLWPGSFLLLILNTALPFGRHRLVSLACMTSVSIYFTFTFSSISVLFRKSSISWLLVKGPPHSFNIPTCCTNLPSIFKLFICLVVIFSPDICSCFLL